MEKDTLCKQYAKTGVAIQISDKIAGKNCYKRQRTLFNDKRVNPSER